MSDSTTSGGAPRTRRELTHAELEPLRRRRDASALLFDVDGTLAPIVPRAEDARVPDDVREWLAELARAYALVGCVSGRRAVDARRVVGLDGISYIGNHGYELLTPGAPEPVANAAAATRAGRPAAFTAALDWSRLAELGVRAEDKGPIQALHWRGAPDEAAAQERLEAIAVDAQVQGLVTHWGRKVLELRPVAGVDKGTAVHALLAERAPLAAALYAGDDRTDLDAFRALRALQRSGRLDTALCVGVASDEGPAEIRDQADLVLEGPGSVAGLLAELAG